jgi:hypothetical protein
MDNSTPELGRSAAAVSGDDAEPCVDATAAISATGRTAWDPASPAVTAQLALARALPGRTNTPSELDKMLLNRSFSCNGKPAGEPDFSDSTDAFEQ